MIRSLSRCPECDLWLRADEACPHMPLESSFYSREGGGHCLPAFAPDLLSPFHDAACAASTPIPAKGKIAEVSP